MSISIVIPTLNEADQIGRVISCAVAQAAGPTPEIIVADCRSTDATLRLAERAGARVVCGHGAMNRAGACNAGAAVATGDVLLFLHADCQVPSRYDEMIQATLDTPGTIGGAFEFALDGGGTLLRIVELLDRVRYRVRGRFYGDQGIFIRRDAFHRIGGFPRLDILEDAHFCRLARRMGRMQLIHHPMLTSPRRFREGGVLRTLLFDTLIWAWDAIGQDPAVFAKRYRAHNLTRRDTPQPAHA